MENQSTKYGNVQKCPQCGASIEPMAVKCSTCGYEFRNVEALKSSQVLANKLGAIYEAYRNKENCEEQMWGEIASTIRNFPVPTTKEDLLDFSIQMKSRRKSGEDPIIDDAYKAKFHECVDKCKMLFPDEPLVQDLIIEAQKKEKGCSFFVFFAIIVIATLLIV